MIHTFGKLENIEGNVVSLRRTGLVVHMCSAIVTDLNSTTMFSHDS